MTSLKGCLLHLTGSISLLVLSLYIPLFFFVYSPAYHLSQVPEIKRTEIIGRDKAVKAISELYGFFRHENALTMKEWSPKELRHLKESRTLFELLMFLSFLSLLFLARAKKKIDFAAISFWNGVGLLFLGIFLSAQFTFFWKQVFHPLLFENDFWKNTPNDLSYYLMPRNFFRKISLWICSFSIIFHFSLAVFLGLKYKLKRRIPEKP